MAKYNLKDEYDKAQFKKRVNTLFEKGAFVDLTDKSNRSLSQNAYLHVIITAFAMETGYKLDAVKRNFYKVECNRDLFLKQTSGELGTLSYLRSSSDLTTEEMTLSIDRFRTWASEKGYYLPSSDEKEQIKSIEKAYDRCKNFL